MKILKKFLINNLDVLMFILAVMIKLLVYYMYVEGSSINLILLRPIFASAVMFCSIGMIFKKKTRVKVLYGLNIFFTILIVSDIVYFAYYRDVLSIPVLRNGVMLGAVQSSVTSLIKPQYLLLFLDIFILPRFYVRLSNPEKQDLKIRLSAFLIMLVLGTGLDASSIMYMAKEQPGLLTTMFNRIYIAAKLDDINFHIFDTYNFVSQTVYKSKPLPKNKVSAIKTFLKKNSQKHTGDNLTSEGQGKNLIVIQVEAMQGFVINQKINGQEITPNMNKWVKRSSYFNNYFYQVASGNTSDAEFMTNNSLYPASEGAACYMYCGNTFASLPKALKKEGYETVALHGYREDFWNRNVMNKAEGFDHFYGEKSFNIDEQVGMGLSDKSFLNQSLDKIKKLKQPFYSFLITLSSHYPYNDTAGYGGNLNVNPYEGTLLGNYLKGIHYTDEQLGKFLDGLEKDGILDNSIVVMYGDHYAITKQDEQSLNSFLNIKNSNDYTWQQLQKVPLIIHFPNDEHKGENNIYAGEMDLYPTLANLFDLPNNYMFGKDIYNSQNGDVTFRNGSFTDGKVMYLSPSDTYYNISNGQSIYPNQALLNQKNDAQIELQYSDNILDHNLLPQFEKKSNKK